MRTSLIAGGVILGLALTSVPFAQRFMHPPEPGAGSAASASPPAPPKTVAVFPVERRDLTKSITLPAELRPYVVDNVYAKVSGYLRDISVDYGSRVSAGEPIAHLDLPEQEADVARTEAAYRLAKLDYDRLTTVMRSEPGLVAQVDVDKARTEYEVSRSQWEYARSVLDYGIITAPFNGIVTKRYLDPGALVQQGTSSAQAQPLVQVADTYDLRLVIETPESIVPKIHVGTPVDVKIQATGEVVQGHVARFSYDVHDTTRTMHTEVDVPNPGLRLKPGMYAYATIHLDTRHDVPVIPTQALATDSDPSVYVVDNDDEIRLRTVRVGMQTPNWVEIDSGLKAGERVFIGDRNTLTVGMKVRPKTADLADITERN